jgi:hypothetical protein
MDPTTHSDTSSGVGDVAASPGCAAECARAGKIFGASQVCNRANHDSAVCDPVGGASWSGPWRIAVKTLHAVMP